MARSSCPLALALLSSLLHGGLLAVAESPKLLTRAADVHNRSSIKTSSPSVRLVGKITYYDPYDYILFVQDASGGTFVSTDHPYPVHSGDYVQVEGFADGGFKGEVATDPSIVVVTDGPAIHTFRRSYTSLVSSDDDSQLVIVDGVVRAANIERHENGSCVHLDLAMQGGEVEVYLGSSVGFDLESLLGSSVEITAVAGGAFDAKKQLNGIVLYAPDASVIHELKHHGSQSKRLGYTDIDHIFAVQRVMDVSPMIKVTGTLTYYKAGDSAVLEDHGKSLYMQTRGTSNLSVGDVVDAFGYPSNREYAPSLKQATIVKIGIGKPVEPTNVTYRQAFSGTFSDNLISLTGNVVSQLHDANVDSLVLNVEGHLVRGSLQEHTPLSTFPIGSRVTMVGICRILPGGPWHEPYLFHLELRTPADAQLIAAPSWWTVGHLARLMGVLSLVAAFVCVWAIVLRMRVSKQTSTIRRAMMLSRERSLILETISAGCSFEILFEVLRQSLLRLVPNGCTLVHNTSVPVLVQDAETSQDGGVFRIPLGDSGAVQGEIVITLLTGGRSYDSYHEVLDMMTELTKLSVDRLHLHEQLVHQSSYDSLTNLPNRRLCESRLAMALQEAERHHNQVVVIFIDINRFKEVNDKHGHKVGDSYLIQIGARLQSLMRSCDTLARVGGDEFIVVAAMQEGSFSAAAIKRRLEASFDEPFAIERVLVQGSASLGLAIYPQDGQTPEDLKKVADYAMYRAKQDSRSLEDTSQELTIVSPDELAFALSENRLWLAYQPQFSAQGTLTGLEALIRLTDPILGEVSPGAFIAAAERHDVILKIGEWVLRQALSDAKRWYFHENTDKRMVVNVAVRQIEQPDFANTILRCLQEASYPAKNLELEITERVFVNNVKTALEQLRLLREAGVNISLDDFGTGQSSLSMLHKLPIDTIKVDRSFIKDIDSDPKVIPIVKAIALIADSLGVRVVAEGIEHVGPVPTLLGMGDIEYQGFLLGRPIAADQIDERIEAWMSGITMPPAFEQARLKE